MVFGEGNRDTSLLVVAMLGTLLVHSVIAQESSASVQSAGSLAKMLKPSGLTHSSVLITPFQSNQLIRSLAVNQHALTSAAPRGVAAELATADLPPTSPKRFYFPGVTSTNLLTPTTVRPATWKSVNTSGANASELRSDRHPSNPE
jgi:hypothetical protein